MTMCLATQHHHRTKTARSSCFKAIDFRSCLGLTCQSYCTIKKRDNTMWSRGHRTLVHVCASTPPLTADGRSERSTVLLGGRQIQEKLLSRGRTFFGSLRIWRHSERGRWMWADFPLPAPRSVAPRVHVAHALAGCTLRPPAAASGPVVVFAFARRTKYVHLPPPPRRRPLRPSRISALSQLRPSYIFGFRSVTYRSLSQKQR